MALPQIVTTLRAKRDEIEANIAELRRQLDRAERDLSSVNAVLTLYELSPETQTKFPAYANLNRLFAYGEMFKLCKRALEEAGRPLNTREIALAVIHMKGGTKPTCSFEGPLPTGLFSRLGQPHFRGALPMRASTRTSAFGRFQPDKFDFCPRFCRAWGGRQRHSRRT